jgi:GNAT superfamily N-acetyltransferase
MRPTSRLLQRLTHSARVSSVVVCSWEDYFLSTVIIRRAAEADAEVLASFGARLFASTYGEDTPAAELAAYLSGHFSPDLQRAEIIDPSGCVFVATDEADQLIGYAHAIKEGEAMLLTRLYLEQRVRGTGLAARLLHAIETQCQGLGLQTLRLSVFDKNARAIAFYQRSGFATVGTASFHIGEDVQSDLIMEKSLALA